MNDINRILRTAAWRLGVTQFLRGWVFALAIALAGLIVARLVEQALGAPFHWRLVAYSTLGATVLAGLAYALVLRPDRLAVARRIDEGANLKESISTALCVERAGDSWSRVTVESAARQARGVRVSQAVPIEGPRFWPVVLALGIALAIVFITVPRFDLLGWTKQQTAKADRQAQIVQAKTEAIDAQKKVEEMVKNLDLDKDKPESTAPEKPEVKDPEAIRKSAIKELSKLSDRLEQLRVGEKAQKLEAMTESLKQLKTPGMETNDLSKSLATGNFKQAQQEVEKLKESLSSKDSKLSESDKQKIAKQLDEIAKQLDQIAKDKQALEKDLEKMGLDKALAKDPDALSKALQNAKNLTEAQKQQIAESAKACQNASQSCQGLSQAMSKMASSAKSGDKQGMQDAAQGAKGQLSDLEQISQDMQSADAALSECKSQMSSLAGKCNCNGDGEGKSESQGPGSSPWSEGMKNGQGGRRGGGGIGRGGSSTSEKAEFEAQKKKDLSPLGQGPIVGSRMVQGESIKGESKAQFAQAVATADQGATEAIENNTIPREFHDAIKAYFGRLKREASNTPDPNAKPADDAAPAKPASDAGKK